jgi:hypothetical protein
MDAPPSWLYVLSLEGGNFFVGLSPDLSRCLARHWAGAAGEWTARYRPLVAVSVAPDGTPYKEYVAVKCLMRVHGVARVRGGAYGAAVLSADALWALEAEVPDARGCCFSCGGDGHWASVCPHSPAPPFWASAVAAAAARIAPPGPVKVEPRGPSHKEPVLGADDPAGLRRCFKCGSADHWASACGMSGPGQVWAPSQQLCTRCGRASHPTADCTAARHLEGWALPPRQPAAPRFDGCARCGQPGHAAARCQASL